MPSPKRILAASTHCPPPRRPWLGRQSWTDMLLVHWTLPAETLAPFVPSSLEVDTHAGNAWLSVVAYQMADVRLRSMPQLLGRTFPQLNLRTYVRHRGRGGIYFLSLDAADALAVAAGRLITGLPYHRAQAQIGQNRGTYAFESSRIPGGIGFAASYEPGGTPGQPSSLDTFLLERYVFYTVAAGSKVYAGEVRHKPWATRSVRVIIQRNNLAAPFPPLRQVTDRTPDYLQFSPGVDVLFWRPCRVSALHT